MADLDPEIIAELSRFPVLEGIDPKYLAKMAELSRVRRYDPGDTIIREGDWDNWIYFLINGRVAVKKESEEVAVLSRAGDLFGEMRIMDGAIRCCSVSALEETTALAIDVSRMDKITGNDRVAFGCVMYKVFALLLAHRLRQSDDELVRLKRENEDLKKQLAAK